MFNIIGNEPFYRICGRNGERLFSRPRRRERFSVDFSGLEEVLRNLFGGGVKPTQVDDEDSMVAPNRTPGKPFKWRTDDDDIEEDDDIEDEYIGNGIGHEPKKKEPQSIFDYLDNGGKFTDICSQAFGLDKDGRELSVPDYGDEADDCEDEVETDTKNPFVFIANRLTFLIKTSQPIIWDTSTIATPSKDCIFVAFDKEKNPQIDMRIAAKIAHKVNIDMDIQDEIDEYLDGTEWETIYCMPHIMNLKGEDRLGFVFAVTSKEDD